jgi:hypothetical protein
MVISAARVRFVPAALIGAAALLGLAACAQPVSGTGGPASTAEPTASSPAPATVVVPSTVYVTPPAPVTVQPTTPLTPCQRMYADGYTYDAAYAAWERAGYPVNWDADKDGLPCEQTYGEQN